jgi:catechol 2,3-dioxygenase-like lactoylglutathione lyase family enzyme
MDLRPHHIGLVVSDIQKSIAFYESLGFSVETAMEPAPGRSITFMRLGEFQLELFGYAERPAPVSEAEGPRIGFRHFALKTGDIDAVLAELKSKGLVAADAQVREVMGRYKLLFLRDPDGIEIEVMQEG